METLNICGTVGLNPGARLQHALQCQRCDELNAWRLLHQHVQLTGQTQEIHMI